MMNGKDFTGIRRMCLAMLAWGIAAWAMRLDLGAMTKIKHGDGMDIVLSLPESGEQASFALEASERRVLALQQSKRLKP
jgi:hypothetical protein